MYVQLFVARASNQLLASRQKQHLALVLANQLLVCTSCSNVVRKHHRNGRSLEEIGTLRDPSESCRHALPSFQTRQSVTQYDKFEASSSNYLTKRLIYPLFLIYFSNFSSYFAPRKEKIEFAEKFVQ